FNMDAGTLSLAYVGQIGRVVNGVTVTAEVVHQNQMLLNAIGAYCRANGISIHVEAALDVTSPCDLTYQWLGPAVAAGLPITAVEGDTEIATVYRPEDFPTVAANMVKIVRQIVAHYPTVKIGEWEGGSPPSTDAAWWSTYDAAAGAANLP